MKRFGCAVVVCALVPLLATATAGAAGRTLYIVNQSTTVSDAEIQTALPAFQQALDQDFAPEWNTDATLVLVPAAQVPVGAWTLTVEDSSDVFGAAGYHWVKDHVPFGRAFTQEGMPWQPVFSHELFEMLADPYCDLAGGGSIRFRKYGPLWQLEVADPVESAVDAFTLPGADGQPVTVSDFVTQRWFDGQGGGPFDFTGHVLRAGQVADGGYVISFSSTPSEGPFRVYHESHGRTR